MITFLDIFNIIIYAILFYIINKQSKRNIALTQLIENLAKEIDYSKSINFNLEADMLFQRKKNIALQTDLTDLNSQLNSQEQKTLLIQEKSKSQLLDLQKKISTLTSDLKIKTAEHSSELKEAITSARKDALKRSRSVMRGQASEHLAPFVIPDTNPKDYRFMGNPVDYICFDGLSDILDKKTESLAAIYFIDIKTGKSSLNKSQRKIRDAIAEHKIYFKTINLDKIFEEKNAQEQNQNPDSESSTKISMDDT